MASVQTATDHQRLMQALCEFRGAAFLTDADLTVLHANAAVAGMMGRSTEELQGRAIAETLPELTAWAMDDASEGITLDWPITEGAKRRLRFERLVFRDEPEAAVTRRLFLVQPAEDLSALNARLGQQSRLTTLGTLVSGIAHEINNPLTGVLGFLELILLQTEDEQVASDLRRAYDAAQRCRRIVAGLLTFARGGRDERVSFTLNDVVQRTVEIVNGSLRRAGIELSLELQEGLPAVTGDFFQIQQVLLNLITNAQHAIESTRSPQGGHVTIRSTCSSDRVSLIIEDDGGGISPEDLARVFDPFFTTKPVGQGTGLGLAVSYGIAKEHGGELALSSQNGSTIATLTLPLPRARTESAAATPRSTQKKRPTSGAPRLRLLLADDEEVIRLLMQQILERDGHEVVAVEDGAEAWKLIESGEAFDGILSDLRMPRMGGAELQRRLTEHDPALAQRMIFITGDVADEESGEFYETVQERTLLKPCTMESVLGMVGKVLGRRGGEPDRAPSISSSRDPKKTL
ncbi:MAG: ATP-binding protein [Planctomycetota bacterium]